MSKKSLISNTNLRIFWSIEGRLKSFYYFVFSDKELYWGNSFNLHSEPQFDIVNLEVGKEQLIHWENFRSSSPLQIKNSYHASGEVHTTVRANDQTNVIPKRKLGIWLRKDEIKSPILLDAVITKSISAYPDYTSKLKKNRRILVLDIEKSDAHKQFFLEFFVCPEGPNIFPEPILGTGDIMRKPRQAYTLSLSDKLILVIRAIPIPGTPEIPVDIEVGFIRYEAIMSESKDTLSD